jgi:peroxiredoxin
MPAFSRLQTKHAANGVQFVGIALDSVDNVRNFSQEHPATYPLLVGGEAGSELASQLGNSQLALPYTLILAPNGDLRFTRLGRVSEQELDTLLQQDAVR